MALPLSFHPRGPHLGSVFKITGPSSKVSIVTKPCVIGLCCEESPYFVGDGMYCFMYHGRRVKLWSNLVNLMHTGPGHGGEVMVFNVAQLAQVKYVPQPTARV